MEHLRTNEQIFYGKNGKPKSVLLDYKVYSEMIEMVEDSKCIKIIQKRDAEPSLNESEFKKKIRL